MKYYLIIHNCLHGSSVEFFKSSSDITWIEEKTICDLLSIDFEPEKAEDLEIIELSSNNFTDIYKKIDEIKTIDLDGVENANHHKPCPECNLVMNYEFTLYKQYVYTCVCGSALTFNPDQQDWFT